jgi:hypothetical protein
LLDYVDAVVIVMSPCLPHAHRVARMLTELDRVPTVIISNRLGRGGETTRSQIESIIGRKLGLELPCWPGLRDAEGERRLGSVRWSRWGFGLQRLARALDAL